MRTAYLINVLSSDHRDADFVGKKLGDIGIPRNVDSDYTFYTFLVILKQGKELYANILIRSLKEVVKMEVTKFVEQAEDTQGVLATSNVPTRDAGSIEVSVTR